jgi:ATP-dependent DNA ligase
MLNTEITFFKKSDGTESNRIVGSLVRTKDPDEVMEKFTAYSKEGSFRLNVFDLLFEDFEFIGGLEYEARHAKLVARKKFYVPPIYWDWRDMMDTAKKEKWEGWVLRVRGDSAVTYTVNGKADRAGAYKLKFMKEGDFVVTEVELGEAGRHAKVYAKFHLGQYQDGEMVDCGWAGPGILTHEELEQYTKEIDTKKLKLPFVVEVEFRDWQEDSTKLEHPVIQRIRFDKSPDECEFEG